MSERDVIFISHATPDDNEFVRWLGTRLTGYGYKVWADIFDLAGGTPFWVSIEDAIRKKALKVIFVVSKASCHADRSGVRNEISVADAVKRSQKDPEFIIPVRIDDVAFGELPIQIHQLNTIDFTSGWGAKLVDLVEPLTKAGVPRVVTDLTAEFDRWRQASVRSDVVVERGEEQLLTNILPIMRLPTETASSHPASAAATGFSISGFGQAEAPSDEDGVEPLDAEQLVIQSASRKPSMRSAPVASKAWPSHSRASGAQMGLARAAITMAPTKPSSMVSRFSLRTSRTQSTAACCATAQEIANVPSSAHAGPIHEPRYRPSRSSSATNRPALSR
ncbi:toll/interleukin-1 receptor domain-containing protein [Bradyrhizobium sp.]|uniref:toll/interleukin-1 receptor domain-containing protein n=1 Tax=Bradyrhizobium sp. TaxID=376 RepID=UPI0026076E78|nr:toll/interleukin-1 receptor domain-containing protein [Bradyrhizobium sp.]